MAQAARLNLRMQRELKLLLSDPPPGASFPFLSPDSDFSSLSIIQAQIEGPEGTVYAKGVFDVKIQIPERYPFQPPNVTLATPIYHPNIDNGGRICLDILNLPPKGAWQPSLNISTVLTSIGLLLSEPNPDDGLMCEVSREYKYNRQAFDLKARSMTEKYAKAGAGGDSCSSQGIQCLNSSVTKFGGSQESRLEENEIVLAHRKHCGISWKFSLESSNSIQNRGHDVEVNEIEAKGKRKEVNITLDECNSRQEKLRGNRRKLSLQSSCQNQNRTDHETGNVVENQSSLCTPPAISMNSSPSLHHDICSQQNYYLHQTNASLNESLITSSQQPCHVNQRKSSFNRSPVNVRNNKKMLLESQESLLEFRSNESGTSSVTLPVNTARRTGTDSTDTCKRIFSIGKTLSLGPRGSSKGQANDDKENVALVHEMPISGRKISNSKSGIGRKLSLAPLTQLQENKENHNSQLLPQCENHSTGDVSLPLRHDNRRNEKQSHLDHDAKVTGKNEQQKTEGSPIPEALVVLDSEDSEEESDDGVLRSKLFRAGKRRGNRIA